MLSLLYDMYCFLNPGSKLKPVFPVGKKKSILKCFSFKYHRHPISDYPLFPPSLSCKSLPRTSFLAAKRGFVSICRLNPQAPPLKLTSFCLFSYVLQPYFRRILLSLLCSCFALGSLQCKAGPAPSRC